MLAYRLAALVALALCLATPGTGASVLVTRACPPGRLACAGTASVGPYGLSNGTQVGGAVGGVRQLATPVLQQRLAMEQPTWARAPRAPGAKSCLLQPGLHPRRRLLRGLRSSTPPPRPGPCSPPALLASAGGAPPAIPGRGRPGGSPGPAARACPSEHQCLGQAGR